MTPRRLAWAALLLTLSAPAALAQSNSCPSGQFLARYNVPPPGGCRAVSGTDLPPLGAYSILANNTAASTTPTSLTVGALGLTFFTTPSSANLAAWVTGETGTGALVFGTSPTLITPALGTPTALVLTNATGLPIAGLTGLGTNVATALAVNIGTAGSFIVNGGVLGTPSSGTLTNVTGLPIGSGVSGLGTGIATALAVNVGTAGAPVINGGVLGTPSSGTLTNTLGLPPAGGGTGVTSLPGMPSGRLTLTSATPVLLSTVSAAGTVFWTPYNGSLMWFYDGTRWYPKVCAELSNVLANSSTGNAGPAATVAASNYDLFVWDNGGSSTNPAGTCTSTRAAVWTNNTTRANGLTLQDGIYLNTSSITNGPAASRGTYVGSIHTDSGSGNVSFTFGGSASGGTAASFGVDNYYNKVLTTTNVTDSGASYTYTAVAFRQARASAGNQGSFMVGVRGQSVVASYGAVMNLAGAVFAVVKWCVGLDSTTTCLTVVNQGETNVATPTTAAGTNSVAAQPSIGFHVLSANELSDPINANTFDVSGTNNLNLAIWN